MSSTPDPSLSVVTLPGKAMAVGFGSKLVVCRYPMDDTEEPSAYNSFIIDDDQIIRAIAFLKIPDGPLCVATAGDSKHINVYNLASWRINNPNAVYGSSDDEESDSSSDEKDVRKGRDGGAQGKRPRSKSSPPNGMLALKPSYRYGPHTKRIIALASSTNGALIFADMFGEVYRLQLCWSPSHTIETECDAKVPATLLLQHFSIITVLYLSLPVYRCEPVAMTEDRALQPCCRLFSCDRDSHCRVSRYPESYIIEQYLWTKDTHPSVISCIVEIPNPCIESPSLAHQQPSGSVDNAEPVGSLPSYYATGNHNGEVVFWVAQNTLPMKSNKETFEVVHTYTPKSHDSISVNSGAVVSIVYLACNRNILNNVRHPCDTPRGVLVACEKIREIVFLPIYDHINSNAFHVSSVSAIHVLLPHPPVAMVQCNDCTAAVLQRDGSLSLLRVREVSSNIEVSTDHGCGIRKTKELSRLCSFNGNTVLGITILPHRMPIAEQRIKSILKHNGKNVLEGLNLYGWWQSISSDARICKQTPGDMDDTDDTPGDDAVPILRNANEDSDKKKKRMRIHSK